MGDPAVFPGLMQMPYTNEELWRARLTESATPGKTDLLLVAELDGTSLCSGLPFCRMRSGIALQ